MDIECKFEKGCFVIVQNEDSLVITTAQKGQFIGANEESEVSLYESIDAANKKLIKLKSEKRFTENEVVI